MLDCSILVVYILEMGSSDGKCMGLSLTTDLSKFSSSFEGLPGMTA